MDRYETSHLVEAAFLEAAGAKCTKVVEGPTFQTMEFDISGINQEILLMRLKQFINAVENSEMGELRDTIENSALGELFRRYVVLRKKVLKVKDNGTRHHD